MEKTKKSIFSKIFVCLSLCIVLLGALAPCFSMTKNEPLMAETSTESETETQTYGFEWGDIVSGGSTLKDSSTVIRNLDFIKVKNNKLYTFGFGANIEIASVKFYSERNLSSSLGSSGDFSVLTEITIPANCNYIRVCAKLIDTAQDINKQGIYFYEKNTVFDANYRFPFDVYYFQGVLYDHVFSNKFDANYGAIIAHNKSSGVNQYLFGEAWYEWSLNFSIFNDLSGNLCFNYPFIDTDSRGSYFILDNTGSYTNIFNVSEINNKELYFTSHGYYGFYFKTFVSCDELFDANNLFSLTISLNSDADGKYIKFNYMDKTNHSFNFSVYVGEDFYYNTRTIYLVNLNDMTDNDYYNQGFSVGYTEGFNKGNTEGNNTGYQKGYESGNTIGYNKGYNDGINDGNQYTFFNLIGATIDAPIKYFQSLFNFELLGVNLSSFLMGLFTLCVVVTIVKLCLGR